MDVGQAVQHGSEGASISRKESPFFAYRPALGGFVRTARAGSHTNAIIVRNLLYYSFVSRHEEVEITEFEIEVADRKFLQTIERFYCTSLHFCCHL